jgi:hypothetical protein
MRMKIWMPLALLGPPMVATSIACNASRSLQPAAERQAAVARVAVIDALERATLGLEPACASRVARSLGTLRDALDNEALATVKQSLDLAVSVTAACGTITPDRDAILLALDAVGRELATGASSPSEINP